MCEELFFLLLPSSILCMNGIKTGLFISAGRSIFVQGKIFTGFTSLQSHSYRLLLFFFFFFYVFPCLSARPGGKGHLLSELPNWVTQTLRSSTADAVRLCVFVCLHMLALPTP